MGTFAMYSNFAHWVHCDYFSPVTTMCSACTQWVNDPLSPVTSIPLSPFLTHDTRQDKTTSIGKTTRYYWYRPTRTGPPRSPRTPRRQFHPPDCSHPIPGRSPCPQPSL